ncbi:MAG: polysaccharide deacetylase family protein [Firmicutes bacterium]|nr:polysaccharide deacetylase family protein [Bacillota bacterium]
MIAVLAFLIIGCITGLVFADVVGSVHEDGFQEEDGQTVYYQNGEKLYGLQTIEGDKYYFEEETGYMAKGFKDIGKYTYYFRKTNGKMVHGFITISGKRYYFGEKNGRMARGFKDIGDYRYYFDKDTGVMAKGFNDIGGYRYYFRNKTGHMAKGFSKIYGEMYHFDMETGHMSRGFEVIGKYTYYFGRATGKRIYGFHTVNGEKYYFGLKYGRMYKGLKTIGDYQYYFSKKDGHMIKGFKTIKGDKYYFSKKNGRMVHQFKTIGGKKYYFGKTSGKMFTGLHKIGKNVYTFSSKGVLQRTVYGDKKAICLTWDDGPSVNTPTIMNALIDNGGRGTFFVVGNRVDSYSQYLKDNYKAGNQIGNHSWSHPAFSSMSADDIREQIKDTNNKIKSVTGKAPTIARTPYGITSSSVNSAVNMPIILWSIDTLDWKTQNADSTYNSIMNNARDGAVVLMHDLYSATASASVRAIPALVDRGYQLVTVEEMALLKGVTLQKGSVYGNF